MAGRRHLLTTEVLSCTANNSSQLSMRCAVGSNPPALRSHRYNPSAATSSLSQDFSSNVPALSAKSPAILTRFAPRRLSPKSRLPKFSCADCAASVIADIARPPGLTNPGDLISARQYSSGTLSRLIRWCKQDIALPGIVTIAKQELKGRQGRQRCSVKGKSVAYRHNVVRKINRP